MKRQSAYLFVTVILALLVSLAQKGRGDFILWNDEQLTVNSYHNQGTLYDTSCVFIVSGGSVYQLDAFNSSSVSVSGGSVAYLDAYNFSTVNISSGSIDDCLFAWDYSTVNISGGSIDDRLDAEDFSAVNISGGSVGYLNAWNSSKVSIAGGFVAGLVAYNSNTVSITGGHIDSLCARGYSTVNISGGSITNLYACDSSVVTFYGQNFHVGGGLTFDGERVLGTGILSGEWVDGSRWVVRISGNEPTATILAIPESEHRPFCIKYPRMDFNGDCKVDFADLAIMASSWLECNLVPLNACWE